MSHSHLVFIGRSPLQGNKGLIKELWTTPCFLNKALFIGGVVALVWGLPLDSHQLPRPEAFRPVLQLWVRCYREMRCSEVVRCLSFLASILQPKIRLESWKYHGNLRLKNYHIYPKRKEGKQSLSKASFSEGGVFRWIALDFYGPYMTQQQMKMNV